MIWLQYERSNSKIVVEIPFGQGPGGEPIIFLDIFPLIEHTIKVHLRIVCNEHWQWISIYNLCLFYLSLNCETGINCDLSTSAQLSEELFLQKNCNTNIHLLPKTFLWQMLMIDFKCEWYSRIYQILAVQFVFKYKKWPSKRRWYTPTCVLCNSWCYCKGSQSQHQHQHQLSSCEWPH